MICVECNNYGVNYFRYIKVLIEYFIKIKVIIFGIFNCVGDIFIQVYFVDEDGDDIFNS